MPSASTGTRCAASRPATTEPSSSRSAHRTRDRATPTWRRIGGATSSGLLELFPDTAAVEDDVLVLGGVRATALASEFGTPLVVYCRDTVLARARAYARVDPDALVVYGTKAFPNVALLRLLAAEGLGADVSTLGELEFARAAGVPGEWLVFHGNNKSDAELRAGGESGALVVLDALEEIERARAAGVHRVLIRLTPGIEAETHQAIRTAHAESKFGLSPDEAVAAVEEARATGLDVAGLHVHIGSQLARADESVLAIERLVEVARRCRDWSPRVLNIGGGLGVRHTLDEHVPDIAEFAGALVREVRARWFEPVRLILEPGRSLIGQA